MSTPYFAARNVFGVGEPQTDRERKLVDALEETMLKVDEFGDVVELRERLKDAVDELAKADESRLRGAPEAEVNLVKAKRMLQDRRFSEPAVPPEDGFNDHGRYDRFRRDRDVTDLLEQLIDEVEAYRKLAGVTS